MNTYKRWAGYLRQTGRSNLTPRQRRRVIHKANRERGRVMRTFGVPVTQFVGADVASAA